MFYFETTDELTILQSVAGVVADNNLQVDVGGPETVQ